MVRPRATPAPLDPQRWSAHYLRAGLAGAPAPRQAVKRAGQDTALAGR
ncbi:hypothetical protein QJS66_10100 [Kocuria rhizophila]|nr:hypothetical protein QJS66_10100 [Kocuria rhizophila]